MKKPKLTHAEHLAFAKRVRTVDSLVRGLAFDCQNAFGRSSVATKQLFKMLLTGLPCVKSVLDAEYHRVTSDAQFQQQGHVYYNRPEYDDTPEGELERKIRNRSECLCACLTEKDFHTAAVVAGELNALIDQRFPNS